MRFTYLSNFISTDELGHGGPFTISDNINYGISKVLMEGVTELGVPVNPSYNSGVNNGKSLRFFVNFLTGFV